MTLKNTTYPKRYTALPGSKVTTAEGGIFAYLFTRYSDNYETDVVHATKEDGDEAIILAVETEQHAPLPREFSQDEVDAPVAFTYGYFKVGEGNILYTGTLESYLGEPFTIVDGNESEEDDIFEGFDDAAEVKYTNFRSDLEILINTHSMENGSNTPDFILAHFLTEQLRLFDIVIGERSTHRGEAPVPVEISTLPEEGEQEDGVTYNSGELTETDLTHPVSGYDYDEAVEFIKTSDVVMVEKREITDGETHDPTHRFDVDVSTTEPVVEIVSPGAARFRDDNVVE